MAAKRVLIVDDNADAVTVLAVSLRRAGHDVHQASDGRSALEMTRKLRPDYLFLDLGLPEIDGHEVARQIRRDPAFAKTRIIALTGSGQDRDRQQALDAGFDQCLIKPVDLAFIDSLLGHA